MAGSATTIEATKVDFERLRSGQALLSVLYGVVLLYYISSIHRATIAIVDEAARRLELEEDGLLAREESRFWHEVRKGREQSLLLKCMPGSLRGLVPRGGVSQRQAAVFAVLTAVLPLAWFSLRKAPDLGLDIAIASLTVVVTVWTLKLLFSGCRHWWWVNPWEYTRRKSAFGDGVPRYWWVLLFRGRRRYDPPP